MVKMVLFSHMCLHGRAMVYFSCLQTSSCV